MRIKHYRHCFVSHIPDELEADMLYISLDCNVSIHKCACGCGEKVVLPIDPDGWVLAYNGVSITFSPSIGNWSYDCKSHYFIRNSSVVWAQPWNKEYENSSKHGKNDKKSRKKIWGKWFR